MMTWTEIVFRGQPAKICQCGARDVPYRDYPEKYLYHIRHADDDMSMPATVEQDVLINHWGVLMTDTPLIFPNETETYHPYIELTDADREMFGEGV